MSNIFSALFVALLLTIPAFVLVVFASMPVLAQSGDSVENPQSGSFGLEGVVAGEPPERAAAINSPVDGQTFTQTPITASGTCEAGLIVEVYKNDTFAGSTICEDNGTFSIEIDVFMGENELFTRVRDMLGQTGPDSETVTITYDPPVSRSGRDIGQQLIVTSDVSFRGVPPGAEVEFPLELSGGRGPYAISVNWGDGGNDAISRSDTGNFTITHVYERPGVYRAVIKATDDSEQTAFLQLTVIASGEIEGGVEEEERATRTERIYVLWPLYVLTALIPVAYWLGMRYTRRRYTYK